MKKIISVLLCLALLLSCAAALAETAEKTELKVNDELTLRAAIPEGYEMIDHTEDFSGGATWEGFKARFHLKETVCNVP